MYIKKYGNHIHKNRSSCVRGRLNACNQQHCAYAHPRCSLTTPFLLTMPFFQPPINCAPESDNIQRGRYYLYPQRQNLDGASRNTRTISTTLGVQSGTAWLGDSLPQGPQINHRPALSVSEMSPKEILDKEADALWASAIEHRRWHRRRIYDLLLFWTSANITSLSDGVGNVCSVISCCDNIHLLKITLLIYKITI